LALDGVRLGPDELATDPDHAPHSPAPVAVDATGFPVTRQVTAPVSSPPPTSETPVGRLTPRTRSTRTGVRVGAAALGVLGLAVVGWVAVRGTEAAVEEDVEPPPRLGSSPGVDAAFEPDAAVADHASLEDEELAGVVRVADHDRRFSLRLPRGWSEVDSPVPTVAAALRAGETVGSFAPSANLVIEPFDGDTRAFVALGLENAAPVSTAHGQRVMELRGAPAVRVTATFRGERPYRAFTYANVVDGVGVVLACYADPEHAEEVEPTCDRIAASLVVD
ncbi:MAG: hypothetical protein KC586_10425, partial [Myxococcales bacterium]|nr:hypothetical protein [Myxococcales bacterium]